jgi:hypothetical protein
MGTYAFRNGRSKTGMATRQHHGKLFSAKAGYRVHRAHAARQRFGDGLQHLVTRLVAIGIIHLFEVVNVQHEQQCRLT